MTGRAAGYCAGFGMPGFANVQGRGFGRGRGFGGLGGRGGGRGGYGRRNRFYATGLTGWQRAAMGDPAFGGVVPERAPNAVASAPTMSDAQQLADLRAQAEQFQDALDGIRERIEELQREKANG